MNNLSKNRNKSNNALVYLMDNKAIVLAFLLAFVSAVSTKGVSFSARNLTSLVGQISVFAIVSIGFSILMAAARLDLSVGEIVTLGGIIYAMASKVLPVPVAMLLCVLTTIVCQLFNGILINTFNLPGFVLTLASGQIFKGIVYLITEAKTIPVTSETVKFFGQGRAFGVVPVPFVIVVVLTLLVAFVVRKTSFGHHLIATGDNQDAAEVSGINTKATKLLAHIFGGACIGLAAIVLTGRVAAATATAGEAYTLDAVAACVIGGNSMHGGKAKIVGTLFGVLLIGIINNMLNLLGINQYWQWMCKGGIIAATIILDSVSETIYAKQRISK